MMVLAAMMIVYGICCFGDMRKPAILYFVAAIINAAVYPFFDALDPEADKDLIDLIYVYGVTESYLKGIIVISLTRLKYRWLLFLLLFHIINDGLNSFHYGPANDALIICELIIFIRGSRGVVTKIFNNLLPPHLRGVRFIGDG